MSEYKPSTIELIQNVSDLICHKEETLDAVFPGCPPFPQKYHVYIPEPGERAIMQELPGEVMIHVKEKAVAAAICRYGKALGHEFKHYHFTPNRADETARYWLMTAKPTVELKDVKPVRQKSEPGKCYRRLDFDIKEGPTPIYDKITSNITNNLEAMEAFFGATICDDVKLQQYLWLHGQGGDGKGTMMRFIKQLLDVSYVVMSDDYKKQDKFFTSRLVGKRIGVFQDCQNPKYVTSSEFLSLSGDDPVYIEKKGKDGLTMDVNAMFVFLSNKYPGIKGSNAHIRRAIITTFKPRDEDDFDGQFQQKLWEERAAVLYKWATAWEKMKAENGPHVVCDKSISMLIADDNDEEYASSFDKLFQVDPEGEVGASEFIDALKRAGFHENRRIGEFKDWMLNTYQIRRDRPRNDDGTRRTVYKGITFAVGAQHDEENPQF